MPYHNRNIEVDQEDRIRQILIAKILDSDSDLRFYAGESASTQREKDFRRQEEERRCGFWSMSVDELRDVLDLIAGRFGNDVYGIERG
jgi:hypothetical protein